MPVYLISDAELTKLFTRLAVESLAVKQNFETVTVGCRRCGGTLSVGDTVTVALTCYQNHSWEIEGLYCGSHGVESVSETMAVRAEHQVVVGATLEAGGYFPPQGSFEPDALTPGAIEILDYSPTGEG